MKRTTRNASSVTSLVRIPDLAIASFPLNPHHEMPSSEESQSKVPRPIMVDSTVMRFRRFLVV